MIVSDQNKLIIDLAQDIVRQVIPEELPLFRSISSTYFKNPTKSLKSNASKDAMLGFGIGEAVVLSTPYVFIIVTEVFQLIRVEIQKVLVKESADVIDEVVKNIFNRSKPEKKENASFALLTHEQRMQIYSTAYNTATKLQLSDVQAEQLAYAVIASLFGTSG